MLPGDCVQFGVQVTEKKQVHSCVIATIRLFLPDGTEAKPTTSSIASDEMNEFQQQKGVSNLNLNESLTITPSQLIELSHLIQDAFHRQSMLENQLEAMKLVMDEALEFAKNGWTPVIEEDRLFQRIESLQAKLEVVLMAKANNDETSEDTSLAIIETLQKEMLQLITEKEQFEIDTKGLLAKAIEDKHIAFASLSSTEMELQLKKKQCHKFSVMVSQNLDSMQSLVESYAKALNDLDKKTDKLDASEEEQANLCAKFDEERDKLQDKIVYLEKTLEEYQIRDINCYPSPLSETCDLTVQTQLNDTKTFILDKTTCLFNRTTVPNDSPCQLVPMSESSNDSSQNELNCLKGMLTYIAVYNV